MPLLKGYAKKIGADFQVICGRKFPNYPPAYEKMQIAELGRNNEWNIFLDADTLVHPDTFDFTNHVPRDTVLHHGADMAGNRWRYDRHFLRDGRHIGSGNWLAAASDWCTPEFWKPLDDLTLEEAVANITPVYGETKCGITPEHLLDDYTMSRNIAKYGLKFTTFIGIMLDLKLAGEYFWHQYQLDKSDKVKQMKETLRRWGIH